MTEKMLQKFKNLYNDGAISTQKIDDMLEAGKITEAEWAFMLGLEPNETE